MDRKLQLHIIIYLASRLTSVTAFRPLFLSPSLCLSLSLCLSQSLSLSVDEVLLYVHRNRRLIRVGSQDVHLIVQELCESRGGRPGLSVLTSLLVSVDAKQH